MVINPTATDPLEGAAGPWSMFVDDAVINASFIPDSFKDISAAFIYIFNIPNYYPSNFFSQPTMDFAFGTPALWTNEDQDLTKGLRPDYIDQSTNFVAWALDYVPNSVVTGPLLIGPFWDKWPTRQSDTSFNKYVCVTNQPSPNAMIPQPYSPAFDNTINLYFTSDASGLGRNLYILAEQSALSGITNNSVEIVFDVSGLQQTVTSDISGVSASIDSSGNLNTLTWQWSDLASLSSVNSTSWTLLGTLNANDSTRVNTVNIQGVSGENIYLNAQRLDNNEFYTYRYSSNN